MPRHDCDREKTMVEAKSMQNDEFHHHHHSNRKSNAVIGHLKLKAIRKRLSKHGSYDVSDDVSNRNINGNIDNNDNNNKRSDQEHNKSPRKKSLTSISSQPIILSTKFSKESSFDSNDIFNGNDEQDTIVPNEIHKDEDIEENIQWKTNSIKSNTNKKPTKLQQKLTKTNSSCSEIVNHSNTKKQRQTLLPKSFQIRDEDFYAVFNDLPPDEQLIIAYPCAWKKDVFMHGRIFLSTNYLLFYARFFKWEESLRIPYKHIVGVTREKSNILLPNAIKLRTINQDEYLFASYIPREKIFIAIFRVWQNALLGQPLDYQQLRAFVFADQHLHDEASGDSEECIHLEHNDENVPKPRAKTISSVESLTRSIQQPTALVEPSRRTISFNLSNETISDIRTCTCENHLTKTYADRLFSFNVDTLYGLLFGDNSFTRAFHKSQNLLDYTFGEWNLNTETGKRERQVTYKTLHQSIIGTNTLSCREKQILEVEKPHLMYIVNTEVYNEGMKYTDAFYVATRFCAVKNDSEHSSLRITAEIKYIKSVNGFVRTFVEKNVNSSLDQGFNEQVRRLASHQIKEIDQQSNQKLMSRSQRHSKQSIDNNTSEKQTEENSSVNTMSLSRFKLFVKENSITGQGRLYDIGLLVGICLLFIHIFLWFKLNSIEKFLSPPEMIFLSQCRKTPGAYVKGAFQFESTDDIKVTGFGVLSGEKYVYEADTNNNYHHAIDEQCWATCIKMLRFTSELGKQQHLHLHGITVAEPPYHSFVVYGDEQSFRMSVSFYHQVGSWYWQTDGLEIYRGSTVENTFFHSNDDVLKIYHSNVRVNNIVVWKNENGPVIQWGWSPRTINDIIVDEVDIIHNRIWWSDIKVNTCIINSAPHYADTYSINTADPNQLISGLTISNVRSEGMSPCSMRIYALSNTQSVIIKNLWIEQWNELDKYSQVSLFKAYSDRNGHKVTIGNQSWDKKGFAIENYTVGTIQIMKAANNWQDIHLGRLGFDAELWNNWDAI
ncbi:unnamed protein product [Rotaria sordida]|uniref:VASt domain-containing protein n=1 Tax=Rotaria sordida TaxID=392033 RepID=A0A814LRC3_9BILA|nr:unnamed protein product [Rotaria sordida]